MKYSDLLKTTQGLSKCFLGHRFTLLLLPCLRWIGSTGTEALSDRISCRLLGHSLPFSFPQLPKCGEKVLLPIRIDPNNISINYNFFSRHSSRRIVMFLAATVNPLSLNSRTVRLWWEKHHMLFVLFREEPL